MKKINKNLENEYIQASPWPEGNMADWLRKEHLAYYKTADGYLMAFEKPRINKDFCFGYGYNGISTTEEFIDAENTANYVKKNESYFVNENLKGINKIIESLKLAIEFNNNDITIKKQFKDNVKWAGSCSGADFDKIVFTAKYIDNKKIISFMKWNYNDSGEYADSLKNKCFSRYKDSYIRYCNITELKDILAIYESIKADLIKRLNTYLKKYGLKNLNVWTYLAD